MGPVAGYEASIPESELIDTSILDATLATLLFIVFVDEDIDCSSKKGGN